MSVESNLTLLKSAASDKDLDVRKRRLTVAMSTMTRNELIALLVTFTEGHLRGTEAARTMASRFGG